MSKQSSTNSSSSSKTSSALTQAMENLIPRTYVQQGLQNIQSRENQIQQLLTHQKLPKEGWDDQSIEVLIQQLSLMDSNNFSGNTGVGEREGRVFSSLVAKRHFYLSHGIGRSGDIVEVQPKAAGSSIIYKLTNKLAMNALQVSGLSPSFGGIVFPLATGMTLALTITTLKLQQPNKKYVLWSRIDQKSCLKSIVAAGLLPIVVDPLLVNGELWTNVSQMDEILHTRSHEILCILSTTSCFAPRQPDSVDEIAQLCVKYDVGHVINNAYGLQCDLIAKKINRAVVKGRVDAVVQSTDKNFMVPVGGAIAISTNAAFLHAMSANYPGRASIAPILDLFITLLSMGEIGYKSLLEERRRLLPIFKQRLEDMCVRYPLQLISSPNNTISYAISIDNIPQTSKPYSFLGSMLFQRNVSGCRVVALTGKSSSIAGATFQNWGSHIQEYPHNYFTAACAIGMSVADIELFISRLDKVLSKYIRSNVESPTAASVKSADTNSGTVAVESVVEAGSERSAEEVKHSP